MVPPISIQLGSDPWEPAVDAKKVKVYSHYEVPLTGIISQSDRFYLFRCVRGELEAYNLWVYAPIEKGDLDLLEQAEDLELTVIKLTTGKPLTVALSDQEQGILVSWELSPEYFKSIFDSVAVTRAARERFVSASLAFTELINTLQ